LLLACCFSAENSRKTATKQQPSKNLDRTWYRTNRSFHVKKEHEGYKKYFAKGSSAPGVTGFEKNILTHPVKRA
jgi:hypothetical protein